LNDRNHEGIFCWENGEKVEHTNWAINLPNDPDGSEDFVYLTNTSMFDLADSSCQRNRAGREKDAIRSLEVEAFPRSAI
jgi:hypothetical protein